MKSNYKDFPQSLKVSTMAPLDGKNIANTLLELQDLGLNSNKVFTYYRGMVVYCHEDKNRYEWTDDLTDKDLLLSQNYKYPRGAEFDGVNYSGLSFNFAKQEAVGSSIIIDDIRTKNKSIKFSKTSLIALDGLVNHQLNIDLIVSIDFIFPKKIYTENCPFSFNNIELMIFGIITSFEVIDNNSFKLNNWTNYQNTLDDDEINCIINYTEIT